MHSERNDNSSTFSAKRMVKPKEYGQLAVLLREIPNETHKKWPWHQWRALTFPACANKCKSWKAQSNYRVPSILAKLVMYTFCIHVSSVSVTQLCGPSVVLADPFQHIFTFPIFSDGAQRDFKGLWGSLLNRNRGSYCRRYWFGSVVSCHLRICQKFAETTNGNAIQHDVWTSDHIRLARFCPMSLSRSDKVLRSWLETDVEQIIVNSLFFHRKLLKPVNLVRIHATAICRRAYMLSS